MELRANGLKHSKRLESYMAYCRLGIRTQTKFLIEDVIRRSSTPNASYYHIPLLTCKRAEFFAQVLMQKAGEADVIMKHCIE